MRKMISIEQSKFYGGNCSVSNVVKFGGIFVGGLILIGTLGVGIPVIWGAAIGL